MTKIGDLIIYQTWDKPSLVENVIMSNSLGFYEIKLNDGYWNVTPSIKEPLKLHPGNFCYVSGVPFQIDFIKNGYVKFRGKETPVHYSNIRIWHPATGEEVLVSDDGIHYEKDVFSHNDRFSNLFVCKSGKSFSMCNPLLDTPFIGDFCWFKNPGDKLHTFAKFIKFNEGKFIVTIDGVTESVFECFEPFNGKYPSSAEEF